MDKGIDQGRETIRLPLYDAQVVRSSYNSPATGYEQYYINCWAEKYHEPGSTQNAAETAIVARPGLAPAPAFGSTMASLYSSDSTGARWITLTNMAMTNLYDVYICAMFDSNGAGVPFIKILMYRPLALQLSQICVLQNGFGGVGGQINPGTNVTINDRVFITEIVNGNGLTPGIVFTWQGADKVTSKAGYALSTAGVFSAASSVELTSGGGFAPYVNNKILTGPFQQMNGNTFIMTQDGFIYNSSLTTTGNPDITTWNTLSTVAASQYPDNGIGIFRYKHMLLAVGTDSIEFFSPDNNNPPASPLVHTDQVFIKFGALNASLCKNIDDIFYWIAFGTGPTLGLWKLDGYTPVKISTPKEDQLLTKAYRNGANLSYYTMEALSLGYKRHICLNGIFPGLDYSVSNTTCLCFNIEDNVWWWLYFPIKSGAAGGSDKVYAILPASAQPGLTPTAGTPNVGAGSYTQYCFRRGSDPAKDQTVMDASNMHQWQFPGTSGSVYRDSFDISPTTTNDVTVIGRIALRNYYFTNTKRKRINRISVVYDPSIPVDSVITSITAYKNNLVEQGSGIYRTDGIVQLEANLTGFPIGTTYWNNFGTGRSLCVTIDWQGGIRCTAVEVDIEQYNS